MNKITGNEPAQPVLEVFDGLTIRQEFAARAMQGLCVDYNNSKYSTPASIAHKATEMADALIEALNNKEAKHE